MTAMELYRFLDKKYPKTFAFDWDNDGIMCLPCPEQKAEKILITLDVTQAAVDYAVSNHFDVIISHHPLLFHPLASLDAQTPIGKKLIQLCQNKIAAFSFHTRMDAAPDGVNDTLAEMIGLKNVTTFSDFCRIGNLANSMTASDFSSYVSHRLQSHCCKYTTGSREALISRVAVCGGDGKEFLSAALENGADAYLTGDLSYNTMTDAVALPMAVVTAGHYETEQPICNRLANLLKEYASELMVEVFSCLEIKHIIDKI